MSDIELLEILRKSKTENGYIPSYRELAEMMGKSTFFISESLKRLEQRGQIKVIRKNGRIIARGIKL